MMSRLQKGEKAKDDGSAEGVAVINVRLHRSAEWLLQQQLDQCRNIPKSVVVRVPVNLLPTSVRLLLLQHDGSYQDIDHINAWYDGEVTRAGEARHLLIANVHDPGIADVIQSFEVLMTKIRAQRQQVR